MLPFTITVSSGYAVIAIVFAFVDYLVRGHVGYLPPVFFVCSNVWLAVWFVLMRLEDFSDDK